MGFATPPLLLLALAAILVAAGLLLVRISGSSVGVARRLAGATEVRVGDLVEMDPLPSRPVRVVGRIRCPDPMVTASDDRLVALHRDVEVQLARGRWRAIERVRESRGFELWDHDGSLAIDPADAAEPLVAIPHVWRGSPNELEDEAHRAAMERLARQGQQPASARSVTRSISVVDRLLVLALPVRAGAGVALSAPRGGFVISNLELPDAMRLLGGRRRSLLLAGFGLMALGALLVPLALLILLLA